MKKILDEYKLKRHSCFFILNNQHHLLKMVYMIIMSSFLMNYSVILWLVISCNNLHWWMVSQGHGFMPMYNGANLVYKVQKLKRNTEYKFRVILYIIIIIRFNHFFCLFFQFFFVFFLYLYIHLDIFKDKLYQISRSKP